MTPEQINSEDALLRKAATELGEHFDSVQIICTRHEPATEDGTIRMAYGTGNFYARLGSVKEWVIMQDEQAMIKKRHEALQDDEEEEDGDNNINNEE